MINLKNIVGIIREISSYEQRTITMTGPLSARYLYEYFTKRHPTYRIFRNKSIGVALIDVPSPFEAFLKGSRMMDMRNKRKRAQKLGYVFRSIKSAEYREDILAVHHSTVIRNGREMDQDYMDAEKVDQYLDKHPNFYGIFDPEGHLRAYCHAELLGEICVICRIMGHADYLNDGIMYLLVSELVRDISLNQPGMKYLMYDTMLGATPGLRHFKDRAGFLPYKVKWRWLDLEG